MSENESDVGRILRRLQNMLDSPHDECDDCWYSCPKSLEGCCDTRQPPDVCTCGKDGRDETIKEAIRVIIAVVRRVP
jgi:hypothetical protein